MKQVCRFRIWEFGFGIGKFETRTSLFCLRATAVKPKPRITRSDTKHGSRVSSRRQPTRGRGSSKREIRMTYFCWRKSDKQMRRAIAESILMRWMIVRDDTRFQALWILGTVQFDFARVHGT